MTTLVKNIVEMDEKIEASYFEGLCVGIQQGEEDMKSAMLRELSDRFSANHADLVASRNDAPDAELCEIYRAQLEEMYRALEKMGVEWRRFK